MNEKQILNFISKEFKSGNVSDQLANYKKLVLLVEKNNLTIDINNAFELLDKSYKLFDMIECINNNSSEVGYLINNEYVLTLLSAYKLYSNDEKAVYEYEDNANINENDVKYHVESKNNDYLLDDYMNSINGKLLTESEERELGRLIKYGNDAESDKAKKKLAEHNLRLVISIAKKYVNHGVELIDLIQEGNLGLLKAIDKFDYEKGYKFSTYATWWIRQSVTRSLADKGRTVRIPVWLHDEILKFNNSVRDFLSKNGRYPTDAEMVEFYGLTLSKIRELKKYSLPTLSLDKPIENSDGDSDVVLGDYVESDFSVDDVHNEEFNKEFRYYLFSIFGEKYLTVKEMTIIKLRYGFDGETKTLAELGNIFGYSRERVRQIESKAFAKIQKAILKDDKMREFVETYYNKKINDVYENAKKLNKIKRI